MSEAVWPCASRACASDRLGSPPPHLTFEALLEGLGELKKAFYLFAVKDTEEKIHGARSRGARVQELLSTWRWGAWPPWHAESPQVPSLWRAHHAGLLIKSLLGGG